MATKAELQAQLDAITASSTGSSSQPLYHAAANADINTSGLWSSLYNTLCFALRASSRATLAADAAVYKTTSVAIKALDNLDIA
jgi:hypothetical protein